MTASRPLPGVKTFFRHKCVVYLLSEDAAKADPVEELLIARGIITVQVLNELAAVASRKLRLSWREIKDVLGPVRAIWELKSASIETYERAIEIAGRYGFSFYDAAIAASALHSGCRILYCKNFQDVQLIANQLRIRKPFMTL